MYKAISHQANHDLSPIFENSGLYIYGKNFLNKYDNLFKRSKKSIMKTDNRKLFEFSIKSFTDYGYRIEKISLDLYNDDITDNIPTEYENKFVSLGQKIYMIEVVKN